MNPNFFDLSHWKKRDTLSELLMGAPTEGLISSKEINAVNRLITTLAVNRTSAGTKSIAPVTTKVTGGEKKRREKKRKTTHYLAEEIAAYLDKVQVIIRSLVPEDLRARISKSHIVNQSLAVALQEFKEQGKNSRLVRVMLQNARN